MMIVVPGRSSCLGPSNFLALFRPTVTVTISNPSSSWKKDHESFIHHSFGIAFYLSITEAR